MAALERETARHCYTDRILKKTRANTAWSTNIWRDWACYRQKHISSEESSRCVPLHVDITAMDRNAISCWLQRFVLEATHLNAMCLLSIGTYMISVVGTCMTALAYLATEMSNCNHRVSY